MLSNKAERKGTVSGGRQCALLSGVYGGGADVLSRILAHLGADQAGEPGDFASRLKALNREILESAGFDECSIEPLHDGWYASMRHAEFHKRAVELVDWAFASSSLFVLKDDAITHLVPFWCTVLKACDIDPVVIDFFEEPARFADDFSQSFGMGEELARAVWLARVLECEQASRGVVRAQLTHDALVEDWEGALARLSQTLGIPWPAWSQRVRKAIVGELVSDDQGTSGRALRKAPQADQLASWVQAAQGVLWQWAQSGEDDEGRAQLDQIRASFEEAQTPLGLAFAAVAEMGEKLRLQTQVADELAAQVAGLQHQSTAMLAIAPPATTGDDGDRFAAFTPTDRIESARLESRWEKVFRTRIHEAEILSEKNGVLQAAIERLKAKVEELEVALAKAREEVERLRLTEITGKAELASTRSEVADLRKSQSGLRKSLDEVKKSLAEERKRASRLQAQGADREAEIRQLEDALMARAAGAAAPSPPKIGDSVKSLLLHLTPKARKKMLRHQRLRQLVLESGMFDASFYASRYPDVVAAGADPLDHFITLGGAEARHPGPSFNSKWYLNENADVRSSGVNPLVHYLEHGRDEGRRRRALAGLANGDGARAEASAAPKSEPQRSVAQASASPPRVKASASELEETWRPRTGGWKSMLSSDHDRLSSVVPLDKLGLEPEARALAVGDKVVAVLAGDTPEAAFARIALFAAMRPAMSPAMSPAMTVAGDPIEEAAPHVLLADHGCGLELIADGWFDSGSGLSLRMSSGFSGVARVFQAGDDDCLHCVADTMLGGGEADCIEVRTVDPLAPLLVVLARPDGALVESAVVPFPSLLRGGLHYGELALLETAPGSMATLAEYSQTLVLEWLGWEQGPDSFAIRRVEIDMRGASGTEPIFRPVLLSSIARHFGLAVRALDGSYAPQRSQLVSDLEAVGSAGAGRENASCTLVIPCDSVPSIYGLVARRMPHELSQSRFAVVDAATARPLADISVPFDEGLALFQHSEMPAHAPYVASSGGREAGSGAPAFPLAVRHYNRLAWQAAPLMPVSPDRELPMAIDKGLDKAISVIIDVGQSSADLVNCLAALERQIGSERLEIILVGWPDDAPLPSCELKIHTVDGEGLTPAGRLNAAAQISAADRLMFLAPSVLLSDPRITAVLSRLADRPATASVACALVTEMHDEGEAKVHSAGYFPTRVSLLGEPVFDLSQFDITKTMPAATFPVVANHAKCVLYDATTFRSLGGFDQQRFPMAMHDLDLGFRALAAGKANLCTSLVRAAVDEAALGADFPDPLAHRSVRPADWQFLFARVTAVRELWR